MQVSQKYDALVGRIRKELRESGDGNLIALEASVTDAQLLLIRDHFRMEAAEQWFNGAA